MSQQKASIEAIVEQAFALIKQGGKRSEEGWGLLNRHMYGRLKAYFRHRRVQESDVEDLISNTWVRLLRSDFQGRTRAIVWVWLVARSVLLDHVASRKRVDDRSATQRPDDDGSETEEWDLHPESGSEPHFPEWAKLCVHRATAQFEHDYPDRALVLRMKAEGWTAEEIAVHFGAKPPPNEQQKTAARNRVLHALQKAREYFAHCKDEK